VAWVEIALHEPVAQLFPLLEAGVRVGQQTCALLSVEGGVNLLRVFLVHRSCRLIHSLVFFHHVKMDDFGWLNGGSLDRLEFPILILILILILRFEAQFSVEIVLDIGGLAVLFGPIEIDRSFIVFVIGQPAYTHHPHVGIDGLDGFQLLCVQTRTHDWTEPPRQSHRNQVVSASSLFLGGYLQSVHFFVAAGEFVILGTVGLRVPVEECMVLIAGWILVV